jgi:uncharacterized membrane protein YphA (DoxX/SURF4 family)
VPIVSWLRKRRDELGDPYLLAIVRIALGLLLLNEAWLATADLRDVGFFGARFHQPAIPESLVPSESVYKAVIFAEYASAAFVIVGRFARSALLVAAALLIYVMLCDRLWFHNYRHTMATFSALFAFAPCDRYFVLGHKADSVAPQPIWAQRLIQAQVSIMYFASAGSKALDPEWRGGMMMSQMVRPFARWLEQHSVPHAWAQWMQTPLGGSVIAKGAITTELAVAIALWSPSWRRIALWVGLLFHLQISLMTSVRLFTFMQLAMYLLFITPDVHARKVRFDPKKHARLANVIDGLDWVKRFGLEKVEGSPFVVLARDGRELRGLAAAAEVFGALVPLFPLWPFVAIPARFFARRARQSSSEA